MFLRTLTGVRAGQVEDYSLEVGRTALANGLAEHVTPGEGALIATPARARTGAVATPAPPTSTRKKKGR